VQADIDRFETSEGLSIDQERITVIDALSGVGRKVIDVLERIKTFAELRCYRERAINKNAPASLSNHGFDNSLTR
jgi:hypothetical protein